MFSRSLDPQEERSVQGGLASAHSPSGQSRPGKQGNRREARLQPPHRGALAQAVRFLRHGWTERVAAKRRSANGKRREGRRDRSPHAREGDPRLLPARDHLAFRGLGRGDGKSAQQPQAKSIAAGSSSHSSGRSNARCPRGSACTS